MKKEANNNFWYKCEFKRTQLIFWANSPGQRVCCTIDKEHRSTCFSSCYMFPSAHVAVLYNLFLQPIYGIIMQPSSLFHHILPKQSLGKSYCVSIHQFILCSVKILKPNADYLYSILIYGKKSYLCVFKLLEFKSFISFYW